MTAQEAPRTRSISRASASIQGHPVFRVPVQSPPVLDALGQSVPCVSYDSWMVYVPEGQFLSRIGPTKFLKDLEMFVGVDAVQEWKKLLVAVIPMSAAAMALPPLSIRGDLGILSTAAGRYAPSLLKSFIQMGPQGALGATKLLRPFKEIVDSLGLKNPFVRNWIDLLCFLLAGVKSDGTLSAEMDVSKFIALPVSGNLEMQSSLTMGRSTSTTGEDGSRRNLTSFAQRPSQVDRLH